MSNAILPDDWSRVLADAMAAPHFAELRNFVALERKAATIYPAEADVFHAFFASPFEHTRVVIVGQDPYHGPKQAHGLCFSVQRGVKPPPSLKNIIKELEADQGILAPPHGCLEAWAKQGVLLLNTVLTVRAGEANSHKDRGWERFTDAAIAALGKRQQPCIFVLWGSPAQKKKRLIDASRHIIIESAHPSPLSAYRGFLGSRPFTQINNHLMAIGQPPINWDIA